MTVSRTALNGTPGDGRRLADGEIDTEITHGVIHYRLGSADAAGRRCGVPIDKSSSTLDQMVAEGCTWPSTRRFSMVLSASAGGYGGTPVASRFPVTRSVDRVRE